MLTLCKQVQIISNEMELNSEKVKEVLKTLPNGYAEKIGEKHGVSPSMVRYAKSQAEEGGRKFRQNTLDIIESLVLLAKENANSDTNQVSRINKLL